MNTTTKTKTTAKVKAKTASNDGVSLDFIKQNSSPMRATNPEHSHLVLQMLIEAGKAYSENDIGNGYLALCRAMAAASVMNEKSLAECYANSPKHQEIAKRADKLFDEIIGQPMSVIHAHKYYLNYSPFRVATVEEY
jgi:hypothetical protein